MDELNKIRREKEWLWHQINHTADSLVVHDVEGRIVDVNREACRAHGYTREDFLKLNVSEFARPFDIEAARQTWRKLNPGGKTTFQGQHVRKDGSSFPVEVHLRHFEWDSRPMIVALVRDVTQRQHYERSFRRVVESAPDPVFVFQDLTLVYANQAAADVLGYADRQDLTGKPMFDLVHPTEHAQWQVDAEELHQQQNPGSLVERTMVRRDGTTVTLESSVVPVVFNNGPAIVSLGRDVSERKRMTAQLMRMDRVLAVGTLAAGAAHEINNPLAYLQSNLSFSVRKLEQAIGDLESLEGQSSASGSALADLRAKLDGILEALQDAHEGSGRIGDIVRELASYSDTSTESARPVDMSEVLDSAVQLVVGKLDGQASVERHIEPVPMVLASRSELVQVFVNLLTNAVQAVVAQHEGSIKICLSADEGGVVVEIEDDGQGIPKEYLDRVFDPFFTTRPVGKGTGLGLSIVHNTVNALGGTIDLDSEVGRGTKVRVRLLAIDETDD